MGMFYFILWTEAVTHVFPGLVIWYLSYFSIAVTEHHEQENA